jgi:hypothetical protein
MKHARKLLSVITLFLFLAVSSPVVAQTGGTTGTTTGTTTDMEDDNDNDFPWGLLGLIGLAGLLGRKRDDDRHRTTTHRNT